MRNKSKIAPILAALLLVSGALRAHAQQVNLGNLSPSTVVGRLGSSVPGPAQAIPFTTLLAQLNGLTTVVSGPATTTVGHLVTWANVGGTSVADSGVAISGSGTIAMGSSNTLTLSASPTLAGSGTLNVASGKTLTDTSGIGAVVLLGATGGGFAAFGGTSCSNGAITSLSATGSASCLTNKASDQTNVASPTGPSSSSAFQTQGLAAPITPAVTGNILIIISGYIISSSATAGHGVQYQIYWGTGSAPSNNHAVTSNCGTTSCAAAGGIQQYIEPVSLAGDIGQPFSIQAVVTGLTVGTAAWVDLAGEGISDTNQSFKNVSVSVIEF